MQTESEILDDIIGAVLPESKGGPKPKPEEADEPKDQPQEDAAREQEETERAEREKESFSRLYTGKTLSELTDMDSSEGEEPEKEEAAADDDEPDEKEEAAKETETPKDEPKKEETAKDSPKEPESTTVPGEILPDYEVDPYFSEIEEEEESSDEETDEALEALVAQAPLDREEKRAVDIWKFAERKHPERYKGAHARNIEFIKKHREAKARFEEEDPDTPLHENEKYLKWMEKNQPTMQADEQYELQEELEEDRVDRKLAAKEKERKRAERDREVDQRIDREVRRYGHTLTPLMKQIGKKSEAAQAITKFVEDNAEDPKVGEKLLEEFPEFGNILSNNAQIGSALTRRWFELTARRDPFDPKNAVDMEIARQLHSFEQEMLHPGNQKRQVRNGKTFATRADYAKMSPEERAKHWTFSDTQILKMQGARLMRDTVKQLDQYNESFKKSTGKTLLELRHPSDPPSNDGKATDKQEDKEREEIIPEATDKPRNDEPPPRQGDAVTDAILGGIV